MSDKNDRSGFDPWGLDDWPGVVPAEDVEAPEAPEAPEVDPVDVAEPAASAPGEEAPTSVPAETGSAEDRKSTRLNSSHVSISYAVFCLKKTNRSIHKRIVYQNNS